MSLCRHLLRQSFGRTSSVCLSRNFAAGAGPSKQEQGRDKSLHNLVKLTLQKGDVDEASTMVRHAFSYNTRPCVSTCNSLLSAMYRARRYHDVVTHFHLFFNLSNLKPTLVSYNILINTHCHTARVDLAISVFRQIVSQAPFPPSSRTYRHISDALISANRLSDAVSVKCLAVSKGDSTDSIAYNNLIYGLIDVNMQRSTSPLNFSTSNF